jgi:hypothetical protein
MKLPSKKYFKTISDAIKVKFKSISIYDCKAIPSNNIYVKKKLFEVLNNKIKLTLPKNKIYISYIKF